MKEFTKSDRFPRWRDEHRYVSKNIMAIAKNTVFEILEAVDQSIESLKENYEILEVRYLEPIGSDSSTHKKYIAIIRIGKPHRQ